jgi:hypothetical protein
MNVHTNQISHDTQTSNEKFGVGGNTDFIKYFREIVS